MKKYVGTINGIPVYSDPRIPDNIILIHTEHYAMSKKRKWYESQWFDRTMVFLLFLALCAMIVFLAAIWNNGSYL